MSTTPRATSPARDAPWAPHKSARPTHVDTTTTVPHPTLGPLTIEIHRKLQSRPFTRFCMERLGGVLEAAYGRELTPECLHYSMENVMLVTRAGTVIAGMLICTRPAPEGLYTESRMQAVAPNYQGMGVGSLMFDALKRWVLQLPDFAAPPGGRIVVPTLRRIHALVDRGDNAFERLERFIGRQQFNLSRYSSDGEDANVYVWQQ